MRFAEPSWLFGTALAIVVAAFLVAGGVLLLRKIRHFGDEALVSNLVTDRAGGRRALKGVLTVLAVAAGFVALAQPQYGRGTRLVPATNLDVIIVLDYSKSMFARDVPPSRIARAKAEVGRLIDELPGARFGAVAFAGNPVSFPLTSDGAAIAQFFRQLSPNDMPVGGTAIARALEAGRRLLDRDPLSKRHARAMLLITDGEDLEGDPVQVAKEVGQEGTTIHVVQIGGRTPEPIPDVDETGDVRGYRKSESGKPLTTSLSAEGERQLTEIAETTGGRVVRSQSGETGIVEVARSLRTRMTEELSERVETVYADVYAYPAALAVLLLLLEAFVPEARRRRQNRVHRTVTTIVLLGVFGCAEGEIPDPFMRRAPVVDQALRAYDAGDASTASRLLMEYLSTGPCKDGTIGTPEAVHQKPNASFDLGLAFFEVAERFGAPFDEAATLSRSNIPPRRTAEIDCALRVVGVVQGKRSNPVRLRAHAHYVAGNLQLLKGEYRAAVSAYDDSLKLVPAWRDQGDPIARWAAHNRAIALRLAEQEEQPPDAGADDPPKGDGGQERADGGKDEPEQQDGGTPEQGRDGGSQTDNTDNQDNQPPEEDPQAKQEPDPDQQRQPPKDQEPKPQQHAQQEPTGQPPPVSLDQRLLDQLEQAPTVQQEAARRQKTRAYVGMEDK